MTRVAVNGIYLNVEISGDGPNLLLLHGFTGDTSTWEPFVEPGDTPDPAEGPTRDHHGLRSKPPVFATYRTIRVDLIGHGRSDSPPDPKRYTMAHAVEDLQALLHHLDVERTALLGYSLGGRVALHFALEAPEMLAALILESASPGIAEPREREARRRSDAELADSILRDGLEAFVDRWGAQPLFASQSRLPEEIQARQRAQRLSQNPLGLANSLRGMGAGSQGYLLPQLDRIDIPSLFLAGALDQRYVALAPAMATEASDAEYRVIEGAGHAVHLERPAEFETVVAAFLAEHVPSPASSNARRSP
jgi:2-succinyl-6-hydroxy-2,4-cyclohexadiene-1-carboxylate synthase